MKSFICVIFTSLLFIVCRDSASLTTNQIFHLNKLMANCGPDTNRFNYAYTINGDVIDFIAKDTAAHLCKCICNYTIEIAINDLQQDSYQLIGTYYDSVYYNEKVFR